jgi:hypothetical protein
LRISSCEHKAGNKGDIKQPFKAVDVGCIAFAYCHYSAGCGRTRKCINVIPMVFGGFVLFGFFAIIGYLTYYKILYL